MKQVIYILIVVFMLSCAKGPKQDTIEASVMEESEMVLESSVMDDIKEEFTYQSLTEQKLQDYYDLLVLQQQHPEFIEDIAAQLQELSNDSITIPEAVQKIVVKNVQAIGAPQVLSDSVQKIKLRFDIIADSGVQTDSITAIISTKKIRIENKDALATRVLFAKN